MHYGYKIKKISSFTSECCIMKIARDLGIVILFVFGIMTFAVAGSGLPSCDQWTIEFETGLVPDPADPGVNCVESVPFDGGVSFVLISGLGIVAFLNKKNGRKK
jgi:hypothetical protein